MVQMMERQVLFQGVFVTFHAYLLVASTFQSDKTTPRQSRSDIPSRSTRDASIAVIDAQKYLENKQLFHHLRHIPPRKYDTAVVIKTR